MNYLLAASPSPVVVVLSRVIMGLQHLGLFVRNRRCQHTCSCSQMVLQRTLMPAWQLALAAGTGSWQSTDDKKGNVIITAQVVST